MSSGVRLAAAVVAFAAAASPAAARDYGQLGTVFPVVEPDVLTVIEQRLMAAKQSGKLAAMQSELQRRTVAKVRQPPPVRGVTSATATRSWLYDPTITVEQDIRDANGIVIIPRGRKVNPLDTVGLRQSLVFINGADQAQLSWALSNTTDSNAKIILVGGSPFELMKPSRRRLYFDQGGQLTSKFSITHVPAIVEQQGRALKITELAIARRKPA